MLYVIARTAHNRPSVMHRTKDGEITECGIDMYAWSRAYLKKPIDVMVCLRCEPNRRIKH